MRLFVTAGVLLLLSACQSAGGSAPRLTEGQTTEAQYYERRRLVRAQFDPLTDLAAAGLEVQRADLMWDLLGHPSVELTRDKDLTVRISLKYWGHERTQVVPGEVWAELAAQASDAFVAPDQTTLERRRREVSYCHSWHELEAVIGGQPMRITASTCLGDLQQASLDYADALARLAIDSIPLCEADRATASIYLALRACGDRFGPPTEQYKEAVQETQTGDLRQ